MNATKILAIGTSLIGGGGLVSAGVLYLNNQKEISEEVTETLKPTGLEVENLNSKKAISNDEPVVSYIVSGVRYTCRIFEVNGYPVNKVLREIKDQKGFLQGIDESKQTFKNDVKDACEGKNSKIFFTAETNIRHVYVYQDESEGWTYSSDLQTDDWTKLGILENS